MEYKIKPHRYPFVMTIIFVLFLNVVSDYYGGSSSLYLSVLLVAVVFAFVQFRLNINEENLVYEILIFNKSIVKQRIFPEEINELKFTRVGWAKKSAKIKVNKGINVRLAVLEPPKAYDHLIEFAEKHDITIVKTKDYLILESMK
ncbi:hypothetical protein [Paenisporosarcina sp. OV554]|uniref:hypothetical protein n=1 Tax=Paenisporosarcina sp. OV554 TaxID=2135694 RepID=UPI000D35286B|nr:hypothetical protein [Paenisporosarcina sp. OV554]PUB09989.1 hypothetical protein C8K15_12213 [Paenisporosarcina sp. OV554]